MATNSQIAFNPQGKTVVVAAAAAAQANAVAAAAGVPAAGVPLVAGAVEILRFPFGSYFSGLASGATTVYVTPSEGI